MIVGVVRPVLDPDIGPRVADAGHDAAWPVDVEAVPSIERVECDVAPCIDERTADVDAHRDRRVIALEAWVVGFIKRAPVRRVVVPEAVVGVVCVRGCEWMQEVQVDVAAVVVGLVATANGHSLPESKRPSSTTKSPCGAFELIARELTRRRATLRRRSRRS